MKIVSLRLRLLLLLVAGATGASLLGGLIVERLVHHRLQDGFDETLLATARSLVTLTTQDKGVVELDFSDEAMPQFERRQAPEYFELWLADGTLVEASRSLGWSRDGGAAGGDDSDAGGGADSDSDSDAEQSDVGQLDSHQADDSDGDANEDREPDGEDDSDDPKSASARAEHRVKRGGGLQRFPRSAAGDRVRDVRLPDGRRGRQVQIDFSVQLDLDDDDDDDEDDEDHEEKTDDGRSGASVLTSAVPGPETRQLASVAVARERGSLDEKLLALRLVMLGSGLLIVLVVAGLSAVALSVGLRPVDRLARAVEALDARALATRLETARVPRELAPVVAELNALLERIEETVKRERQLTSDIAHDLKTPVAELRAACDVALRWPEDREASQRFFEDARDVAQTLDRTIARLLALARHESGLERLSWEKVDLAELVDGTWSLFAADARRRGLALLSELERPLLVESDREKLSQVLANLLENAVEHAPEGSQIHCQGSRLAEGRLELRISNAAPGLVPDDLPHVFERFWRKDHARTDRAHAGLGLALARANASLLRIELEAELDEKGRFVVLLRLPRRMPLVA